jgi:putative membrane protein
MPNSPNHLQEAEAAADPRVDLAIERTELALERTQLAWLRTTLAFLGSGLALDKGMEFIHQKRVDVGKAFFDNTHIIGISLSVGGTLTLALSTIYFIKRFRALSASGNQKTQKFPPVFWASMLVILLGLSISALMIAT